MIIVETFHADFKRKQMFQTFDIKPAMLVELRFHIILFFDTKCCYTIGAEIKQVGGVSDHNNSIVLTTNN